MAQYPNDDRPDDRDRHYEETGNPKNPPNSVLQPAARRATVATFVGGIVVFFLIVGVALVYWNASNRRIDPDPGLRETDGQEIGTAGERTPGGGSADPSLDSPRDELEFRGGDDTTGAGTELRSILEAEPSASIGRRVTLHDVDVASVEGGSFWIHDGNARVQVRPPSGAGLVRDGQVVDVSGVVESDGADGIRIRADRVTVR
jgi:hypothetical protein